MRAEVKPQSLVTVKPLIISKILNAACGQGGFFEGSFAAVDETVGSTDNAEEILVGAV